MPRPKAERPTYSLTRRGRRYYVQWWESGAARRVSCRTEVLAEARRFLAEFKVGREVEIPPDAPSVAYVLAGYLKERSAKVHSDTLKYCCAHLSRHLGDLPVDMLGKPSVRGYCDARRREGPLGPTVKHRIRKRTLSDGTLIRELGTLRAALEWAVGEKIIKVAPFIERPEAPSARDRWLTRHEANRLINAAHAAHIRLFIALALHTSARSGAVLGLTWDRVDFQANIIDMGASRGKKRRTRHLPITDDLRPLLAEAANASTCPYVVEHGGKPVRSIKTGFRAAVRRAHLTGVTPHVLRHTAVTWMVQANVPLPMVAAYASMSLQMVQKVYGHHSPDWLRQAAAALSRQVAEKTESS